MIQLSTSTVGDFLRCPKIVYFEHLYNKTGIVTSSPPSYLALGTMVHEMLATLYAPTNLDMPLAQVIEKAHEKGRAFAEAQANAYYDEAAVLFDAYVNHYTDTLDEERHKVLAVEQWASVQLEPDVEYRIKADLVQTIDNKRVIFWDHKTAQRTSSNYYNMMRHSPQFISYGFILGNLYQATCHKGVLNIIKKAKVPEFHREIILFYPELIAKWVECSRRVASNIRTCLKTDNWPRNMPWACHTITNACQYLLLCKYGENETTLRQYIKQNPERKLIMEV